MHHHSNDRWARLMTETMYEDYDAWYLEHIAQPAEQREPESTADAPGALFWCEETQRYESLVRDPDDPYPECGVVPRTGPGPDCACDPRYDA